VARGIPFPLSKQTPIPDEIIKSIEFVRDTDVAQVRRQWTAQLADLSRRAQELESTKREWDLHIPKELQEATGKLHVPLVIDILSGMNLGGHAWFTQFISGFPLIGSLSQDQTYPKDPEAKKHRVPEESQVAKAAWERFEVRKKKHGDKTGAILWDEAAQQVEKGWLSKPLDLAECQASLVRDQIPPAFRFGVHQADKVRACDDLKDNGTNALCLVETPITVPSWDHVVTMCDHVRKNPGTWFFGKVDHESAYKFLPIRPDHMRFARIILRSPVSGELQMFQSKVLPFGSVAAVLHYNVFARTIAHLINEIFRIPVLNYFDDFGFLTPGDLTSEAMQAVSTFCQIFNIRLKIKKSEYGPEIIFLGLKGSFPSHETGMNLQVSLPEEKAKKWTELIRHFITQGAISAPELESVIGKIGFSQTHLFGKFSRAMLRDLYRKLNRKKYTPVISLGERETLKWWYDYIQAIRPRIARVPARTPQVIVYTDARGEPPRISAVFIDNTPGNLCEADLTLASDVEPEVCDMFKGTSLIYALEAIAAIAAIVQNQEALSGKAVMLFVDNTAALNALLKSTSPDDVTASLIRFFWSVIATRSIDIWIEWVPSAQNIADAPSRKRELSIPTKVFKPFSDLTNLIIQASEPDKKWSREIVPLNPGVSEKPLHHRNQ